jgi:histidinol-phosphate aminotransferase
MAISQRSGLADIPAYRQGSAAEATSGLVPYKLSSNENPYPPLPSVLAAVGASAADVNRYPDMAAAELAQAVAAQWGVAAENICFGAGSVDVASQLIHAVANPGDQVMFAWRSFEAYPSLATVAGAVPQPIPLTADGGHDLTAMAAAITPRTKLVFVCNPNNPNGAVLSADAVDGFVRAVPDHVVVVIDEAYVQFNQNPGTAVGIDLFKKYPNVVVLHTFSKAYGLAGLRVGYAIAPIGLAENLRKVAIPFTVTNMAQSAALVSLRAPAELAERVRAVVSERDRLHAGLAAAGLPVRPSEANFVWLDCGSRTTAIAEQFEANALAVRVFPGEGIRISVGEPEANSRVLETAAQLAALLVPAL